MTAAQTIARPNTNATGPDPGWVRWTRRALVLMLVMAFLGAGLPKLLGVDTPSGSKADFERWGYPPLFRNAVGGAETAGALLLLLVRPRVLGAAPRFWASLGLVGDMVGAMATHLIHGEAALLGFPAFLLALAAALAYLQRPARAADLAPAPAARTLA